MTTVPLVRTNGENSIYLADHPPVQGQTLAVSAGVRAELERIRPQLLDGVRMIVATDDAPFIQTSIDEVVVTLLIAVGVVVLVIFAFLYSLQVATPDSGPDHPGFDHRCLHVAGGAGVLDQSVDPAGPDWAIGWWWTTPSWCWENAQRRVDHGEPPLVAVYRGTRQATFAVWPPARC